MRPFPMRAKVRPLFTVVALCGALAIAPAAIASATPRSSVIRRIPAGLTRTSFERRALSLIRSRSAARSSSVGPAEAIPYNPDVVGVFHVRSHDANYPNWFVGAFKGNGETYVAFATERETPDGYQLYEWIKEVPNADVIPGSRLLTFTIRTGTDLGAFGSIDMTFSATHRGTHRYHCEKTGKLTAIDHRAQGSFSGTMSFYPGLSGLPTVLHATTPHGMLDRIVTTGARCPQPYYGPRCYTSREFVVRSADGGTLRIEPKYGFGFAETTASIDGFTIYREVAIFPGFSGPGWGDSPVTLTHADLTIDGDAMGDLFAGTVVFDRSSPSVIRIGPRCKRVTTPFLWHGGSFDVNFDSGTYSFTGADLDARLHWRGRA